MADAGFFRDKSDNKLVSSADSDMTPPTDHDFILASTIKVVYDDMIYQGGTWDGTAYVPPVGMMLPYDTSTDLGRRQVAAEELHEWLHSVTEGIHEVRHEKSGVDTAALEQFVSAAHWVNYVVAHMTSIDADEFKAWAEAMMEWPENVTGTTRADRIQKLYEEVHEIMADAIPTVAAGWVNPADLTDVAVLGNVVIDSEAQLLTETTDLTDINLGNGAWIMRLPAA